MGKAGFVINSTKGQGFSTHQSSFPAISAVDRNDDIKMLRCVQYYFVLRASALGAERAPSVPSEPMADSGKIRGMKEVVWCLTSVSTKLKLNQKQGHKCSDRNDNMELSSNLKPGVTSKVS